MAKSKKFKIYTHAFLHLDVRFKDKPKGLNGRFLKIMDFIINIFYLIGVAVLSTAGALFKIIYLTCFHVGNVFVKSAVRLARAFATEIKKTSLALHRRRAILLQPQFKNALVIFLAVAFFSSLGFAGMHLVARGLALKGQVLGIATDGEKNLLGAESSLRQQNLDAAKDKFMLAYQSFANSQQDLQKTDGLLNQLLTILPQKRDADKLFSAASLLSRSGADLVDIYQTLNSVHLSAEGLNVSGSTSDTFTLLDEKINSVGQNLTEANKQIADIDPNSIPKGYQDTFVQMKGNLNILQNSYQSFRDIFNLAQKILLGSKNVLVLFENNNELRPTGGFMGTFGNLKLKDGSVSKINISSIYDLDGQLMEKIIPPTPVLNVSDRWFLRDSNWFADFPESASKITSFYEKEGGETPDLIIAMTPDLVVDLLKITGPVTMKNYNVTLDENNFVEQAQAVSTKSQGPLNNPKQVLADFFPVLLQKLGNLPAWQWPVVLESLQNNLNGKQLVLFSRDSGIQRQLENFNWAGTVMPADRDYLSIVSSNLGGTKTDLYIDQQIGLKTSISGDGSILDELTITRTNNLPKMADTENDSFLRIFVPEGSALISNTGFDFKDLDNRDAQDNFETDPQVYDWEKASVRDVVTGTVIGREAGKTFFGNWLNLNGGESKTVKLVYRLPFKSGNVDRYSILLQKQIGSKDFKFNWNMDFSGRSLEWKNFDTQTLDTGALSSSLILNRDYFLGAVLRKR